MEAAEIEIIKNLTGIDESRIRFSDDGFMSRGYVIDGGRLVFKFKKRSDTTYVYEIQNLDYLNQQNLGVHLQRVAFKADDDRYLGIYGVPGVSLEQYTMDNASCIAIGRQLGEFLRTAELFSLFLGAALGLVLLPMPAESHLIRFHVPSVSMHRAGTQSGLQLTKFSI